MIFPAIDLMDGGCVRLVKGDFDQRTNYNLSPLEQARSFADDGAEWIHIVDLDGAKNESAQQSDLIINIAQNVSAKMQTGGGIRNEEQIKRLLDGGIARIVIGSLAANKPRTVKGWMEKFGADKFCLAFDVNVDDEGTPRPAVSGWQEDSHLTLWETLEPYLENPPGAILVTDISKDGVLAGTNIELYRDIITRYPELNLITSGGVGSLDDVKALKQLDPYGIIIGKAIYEGRLTLKEAITCSPAA